MITCINISLGRPHVITSSNDSNTPASSLLRPVLSSSSPIMKLVAASSVGRPVGATSSVVRPVSATSSVVRPVSATSSVVRPVSATSSVVRPVSATSSVVRPVSATSSVGRPVGASSVVRPVSATSSVVRPVSATSSVVRPVSATSSVGRPVGASSVVRPVSATSSVGRPVVATSSVGRPVVATSSVGRPVVAASSVGRPVVATSSVGRPVGASSVVRPVSATSSVVRPVSATSSVVRPVSATSSVGRPVDASSVVRPVVATSSVGRPVVATSSVGRPVVATFSVGRPVVATSSVGRPVGASSVVRPDSELWISDLGLFFKDKKILQSDEWLNDNIIQAAQVLLKGQFGSDIAGWQSPLLGQVAQFKTVIDKPFLQTMHISNHWILVSNMPYNKESNNIYIYDSLLTSISDSIVNTVCSFFKWRATDPLNFDMVNLQRQTNSYDCGVFCVAFATELAYGGDPAKCSWYLSRMRSHLIQGLENQKLQPFPKMGRRTVRLGARIFKSRQITIYCVCRMPNDPQKAMVQCCSCLKWFHIDCCIPDKSVDLSEKWSCSECSFIMKLHE